MKTLTLYIDKWYIIGAVCADGVPHPISLPNGEDRIWLYFYEDIVNNRILYGRDNMSHYRNKENHYYGDVFSIIMDSRNSFLRYGHEETITDIFSASHILDDLANPFESGKDIPTYVAFSSDISAYARQIFLNILKEKGFLVDTKQSVARIDHLAMEFAYRKGECDEEGKYLVLNSCNENLHYSLYQFSGDYFVRLAEEKLDGMGVDLRGRALVETVVEDVNRRLHFLQDKSEKESECLRMTQLFLDKWLVKMANAKPLIPIPFTDVWFAVAPYNKTSVSVKVRDIDERTKLIVSEIVREVTSFVKRNETVLEEIKGVLFLGNSFSNNQFEKAVLSEICLTKSDVVRFREHELPNLVGVYSVIDCAQFTTASETFVQDAKLEQKRKQNAILDEENRKAADAKKAEEDAERNKVQEAERGYKDAMGHVSNYERKEDYAQMLEWCDIALTKKPGDNDAQKKKEEAQRLLSEQKVKSDQYNEIIKRAKASWKEGRLQDALSQSEMALNFKPDSKEAQRIHDEASQAIERNQKVKDYLTRADLFMAQKLYTEAAAELEKARFLDEGNEEIVEREKKITEEQDAVNRRIEQLKGNLNSLLTDCKFDEALKVCNELIEVDIANSRFWSTQIADINAKKERALEEERQWEKIKHDINSAQWNENYTKMIELCNKAITIRPNDNEIKELLENAERKVKEQRIESLLAKTKIFIQTGSYAKAIESINYALELDSQNSELLELKKRYSEKLRTLKEEIKQLAEQVRDKELAFDFKSAIELCSQLLSVDIDNKEKWQSEYNRLQSLQIEKSELELNFRRKKADIKQMIRSGNFTDALEQIKLFQLKCHSFGITSHNEELSKLKDEIGSIKTNAQPTATKSEEKQSKPKYENLIKTQKTPMMSKGQKTKSSTIKETTQSDITSSEKNEIDNVGSDLLKRKQYIQAKRHFALAKNNFMADICSELIKLEKAKANGTISSMDLIKLNELYIKYNINF